PCSQEYGAKDPSQPWYRHPRAQMRADDAARNRPDQQRPYQNRIDVSQPEVQQTGHTSQKNRMHNVRPHHLPRMQTKKKQQQHHNYGAGAYGGHADQKATQEADGGHSDKGFHGGRAMGHQLLDAGLEQQQGGNDDEKNADGGG